MTGIQEITSKCVFRTLDGDAACEMYARIRGHFSGVFLSLPKCGYEIIAVRDVAQVERFVEKVQREPVSATDDVGAMLEAAQEEPDLVRRERECFTALCGDDACDSNGGA